MRKAIVIGASSGIGRELAKLLSANGYDVEAMARRTDLLETLRRESGDAVRARQIDVSDADAAMTVLKRAIEESGSVDLIVISAGTGHLNDSLEWQLEYDALMTNVIGFTAVATVALNHFLAKGSGHLVAISSVAALRGGKQAPAYNASKAFESNYLEGLRQKVASARVPVVITDIRPGFVDTAMAKGDGVFWAAPPEKAAAQILRAIGKRKTKAYVTKRWALVAFILKIMPGFIYDRL